ncbi:unnamed protein product [Pieris macdunnoughi]|uniref:Uncharacterized protein n=1 Tax=Pieris macdunnoughi TaxID=345717 RepID=A0A821U1K5_9NEOP|nr:unnamed protein product [Pieris macdunnoughi]
MVLFRPTPPMLDLPGALWGWVYPQSPLLFREESDWHHRVYHRKKLNPERDKMDPCGISETKTTRVDFSPCLALPRLASPCLTLLRLALSTLNGQNSYKLVQ